MDKKATYINKDSADASLEHCRRQYPSPQARTHKIDNIDIK